MAVNQQASSSSYGLFAEALSQSRGQDAASLLDPTTGLALLFAEACQEQADDVMDQDDDEIQGLTGTSKAYPVRRIQQSGLGEEGPLAGFLEVLGDQEEADDAMAWQLEGQTWRLIHQLYGERMQRLAEQRQNGQRSVPSTSSTQPYRTPFAAVQDILEQDATLAELKIVRDWLSSNLSQIYPVEVRKGYWPFTRNRLAAERRSSKALPTSTKVRPSQYGTTSRPAGLAAASGKGVKHLDPDAATREGSTLELEDAAYEKALNKTLFEYVRGGQLDNAVDLARQTDRSWRAASLRGANLYWRPGLDQDMDHDELTTPMGNRNRALWKAVCGAICARTSLDEYERALYGALCGDLPSVMTVSTSWEAQLWAHVNARFEAVIDQRLDALGTWWGQEASDRFNLGSAVREAGAVQLKEINVPALARGSGDADGGLREVFVKLAQTEQHGIHAQAAHPFRVVQRAVIQAELATLLTHVDSLIPSMRVSVPPHQFARLMRFFAHLILFLRLIRCDDMPNDTVCNSILKAYVDVLENVGEADLVALYASSLEAESAKESYAHYLKLIDAEQPLDLKRAALLQAQTHDLDVAAVAVLVVQMLFDEIFPTFAPLDTLALPTASSPLAELSTTPTPAERRLIRAMDWLCIHESTHIDAIVYANMLLRLFLNHGRLNAARTLLYDLPADVVEKVGLLEAEGDGEAQAMEFVHWRCFFEALDRHLRFVEVWSRRAIHETTAGRPERMAWTKALTNVVDDAQTAMMQVLQMDWIKLPLTVLDPAQDHGQRLEQRLAQLARIRQIYVPELVMRLHQMLFDVHAVLPHTLVAAVQLPTLVADERHKLYLDFIAGQRNRLPEYLSMVREVELASLEHDADPFALARQTV